jgi:hypothetical protein
MRTFLLRVTALAAAAGLSGMIACGSSSGCGGSTQNPANTSVGNQGISMNCGAGTVQVTTVNGPQCIASSTH